MALKNQHHDIISLLLSVPGIILSMRNKRNQTPFSLAMTTRNNKAAFAILDRSPNAAEQVINALSVITIWSLKSYGFYYQRGKRIATNLITVSLLVGQ